MNNYNFRIEFEMCKWSIFFKLCHGKNKLLFHEMMMSVLYQTKQAYLDFHSSSSLKQTVGRQMYSSIRTLLQSVFALTPSCCIRSAERQQIPVLQSLVFSIKLTIYVTQGEQHNHYTTKAATIFDAIITIIQIYHVWEGYLRKIPVERRKISLAEWRGKFSLKTGIFHKYPSQT